MHIYIGYLFSFNKISCFGNKINIKNLWCNNVNTKKKNSEQKRDMHNYRKIQIKITIELEVMIVQNIKELVQQK
jgi:hypothetical protein